MLALGSSIRRGVFILGNSIRRGVFTLGNSIHCVVFILGNSIHCAVLALGNSYRDTVLALGAACDNIARRAPTYGQTEPTYGTHERGIYRRVIARAAVSACRGVAIRGQRWVPSCLRLVSRLDRNKRYFQWYRRASADVHRNTKTRVAVR